jgi:PAS domain S-box-containing protein
VGESPDPDEFEIIANSIPTLCWLADASGAITWYNAAWYEYTGSTVEEMAGWGWKSVHHPRTLGDVLDRWVNCLATGEPFEMIFPLRGADGIYRPFLTRVTPQIEGGKVRKWFGANSQLSDRNGGSIADDWKTLSAKMGDQ